jgi:hypothetical protein
MERHCSSDSGGPRCFPQHTQSDRNLIGQLGHMVLVDAVSLTVQSRNEVVKFSLRGQERE